jgi:hypothetical protein
MTRAARPPAVRGRGRSGGLADLETAPTGRAVRGEGHGLLGLCQAAERFSAYQAEHGYELEDHRYLVAFISRRVNGAILDWARSRDYLSRAQRHRLKAIEEWAPAGASTAEQTEVAGLTEAEVRNALALEAARPVCLEDECQGITAGRSASPTRPLTSRARRRCAPCPRRPGSSS